jgi:hypothetical protein
MDQRLPPCAYWALRLPVPPMTTPTTSAPLYTAAWPHHPNAAYWPLLPSTVGVTTSDHGQSNTGGYSCSPYSMPPTFSQIEVTSPGHVTQWWVREGHNASSPHWANMSYFPYTYTGPTPCGPDSETQDDRFRLSEPGEMQMPATGLRQMLTPAER